MRILLCANASYLPPRGGSTRSNLAFLATLVERGHQVRVVSAAPETMTGPQRERLQREVQGQGLAQALRSATWDGIEIHAVPDLMRRPARLRDEIREFQPDWLLISSEDLSHALLREAVQAAASRTIYLAHTPQFLPFGPESWHPDMTSAKLLSQVRAVLVIGAFMASYVRRHLGLDPVVVHPPIYRTDAADLSAEQKANGRGSIAIVNPCAVKGMSLFAGLADALPELAFAALPGWGTTAGDLRTLQARKNIQLLSPPKDINDLLREVRILLVPSLWLEGFGLIAMEAMLRGVPVIASDYGGLREAKNGTGGLLPVRPITEYQARFDDRNMPLPVLPDQDLLPWVEALRRWTADAATYSEQVQTQQEHARNFVEQIDRGRFERLLVALGNGLSPAGAVPAEPPPLSDARRQLLLRRLRQKRPHPREQT